MTKTKPKAMKDVLFADDVAALFTREAGRTIQKRTVLSYLGESKPGGRYEPNPMPAPADRVGRIPFWTKDQEQALITWWHSRPGVAHGTGGRRAGSTRR